ncbi:MAG: MtnX-like HAD-IB family phosphatase [Ignavibacteria bacterium]|nr:MtnX-like HAD-IB family phosphatase [Ignavibacteria bacterium]
MYPLVESTIAVFCDFDGTITRRDVGDAMIRNFGIFEPFHTDLLAGKMTVAEYYRKALQQAGPDFTPETIEKFTLEMEMDAYFPVFFDYCREHNIPLMILSDGFQEYIQPILLANNIDRAHVMANNLNFQKSGVEPIFPNASENCNCFCASCKRNSMLATAQTEACYVYIGDGLSDTCAASHADVIFAKGALAAFCNEHRIPHYTFHTFFDVLRIFKKIVMNNQIKHRRQAELLRKKSVEIE